MQGFLPNFGDEPIQMGIDEAGRGPVLGTHFWDRPIRRHDRHPDEETISTDAPRMGAHRAVSLRHDFRQANAALWKPSIPKRVEGAAMGCSQLQEPARQPHESSVIMALGNFSRVFPCDDPSPAHFVRACILYVRPFRGEKLYLIVLFALASSSRSPSNSAPLHPQAQVHPICILNGEFIAPSL